MQIPRYTRGIIRERQTPTQLEVKSNVFNDIAQVSGTGVDIAEQFKLANDTTAVNEAVISAQKQKIELSEAARKERQDNPFGFAKEFEPKLKKLDDEIAKSLPSAAARKAYQETAARSNLELFEQNFRWQNEREANIYASRIEKSLNDNATLAYRAGQEGQSLDDYLKNVDASTVAAGSVFAREKLEKLNGAGREKAAMAWLSGMMQSNLSLAKEKLDSGELDFIGADNILRLEEQIASIKQKRAERQQKLFNEDPAALAIESGASPSNYTQILDLQQKVGVPEDRRSIIPKQIASQVSDQLNNAGSADAFIITSSQSLQNIPIEYVNIALRDLKKAGLSDQAEFMMLINPETHKQHINALFEYSKEPEAIRKLATSQKDVTINRIEEAVSEKLQTSLQALSGEFANGGIKMANMQQSMTDMATYYVAKGKSIEDASELATAWFNQKTPTAMVNGRVFRVPEGYDPDDIESAIEQKISSIKWNDFPAKQMIDERTVYPVLYDGDTSYYFKSIIDEPITDSKGELVIVNIDKILLQEQQRKKKLRDEAIQEWYKEVEILD